MIDTETKQQLLEKFTRYLDEALNDEPQNQVDTVDLYQLFIELSALKTEVKIESRQIKSALEEFQGLTASLQSTNEQLREELQAYPQRTLAKQEKTERSFLLELLDIKDRLSAGVEQAGAYQPKWLAKLDGTALEHIQILQTGMGISIRRLDNVLARYSVKPISAIGKKLDPHTMQVTAVEQHVSIEEGIVLIESRKGYLRAGKVLRLAEVIVNKRKTEEK